MGEWQVSRQEVPIQKEEVSKHQIVKRILSLSQLSDWADRVGGLILKSRKLIEDGVRCRHSKVCSEKVS